MNKISLLVVLSILGIIIRASTQVFGSTIPQVAGIYSLSSCQCEQVECSSVFDAVYTATQGAGPG